MLLVREARFSLTKPRTWVIAMLRFFSTAARSWRSSASRSAPPASESLNWRTVWSFLASVLVNFSTWARVPNSSSLLSASVLVKAPKFFRVLLNSTPWPPKLRAVESSSRVSGPTPPASALLAPSGPSAMLRSLRLLKISSSSSGRRRLVDPELGVVRHLRAAGVRRGQLHEPVPHDRGRDDRGLGVGRHLVLGVVVQLDPHLGAGRGDRVDLADGDAEDLHVRALVEGDGAREVGDDVLLVARPARR